MTSMSTARRPIVGRVIAGAFVASLLAGTATSAADANSLPKSDANASTAPISLSVSAENDAKTYALQEAAKPKRLAKPRHFTVILGYDSVYMEWDKVKRAKSYWVYQQQWRGAILGPPVPRIVKTNHITIPYNKFVNDHSGKPFVFWLSAHGKKNSSAVVSSGKVRQTLIPKRTITKKIVRKRHERKRSWLGRVKHLATRCTHSGTAIAVGTVASGGIMMAGAMFIPPAEAVTASAVGLTATAMGVGGAVTCVAMGGDN